MSESKEQRKRLCGLRNALGNLRISVESNAPRSRSTSCVLTKMDEAEMWFDRLLSEMEEEE